MLTLEELASGKTFAEECGMTAEIGRAAASLAAKELAAGRLDGAREMAEGLALANPHDPAPWAMLALVERRRGRALAARLCSETAYRLAPEDPQVRLVRAEVLLCFTEGRAQARAELAQLATVEGVSARARALLVALGE